MFDAMMRISAANANMQFESLSAIATNVSNMNTKGYKVKRFEQYLNSNDQLEGITRSETTQGLRSTTGAEKDIAIEGKGYIPVTQPDGTVAYTRDGSMTVNSKGYLVTQQGDIVGSGIKLPEDYTKMQIKQDGSVQVVTKSNNQPTLIGKISTVRFINPENLTRIDGNKLLPSKESGSPMQDPDSKIYQGMLEQANVVIGAQIEQVLRLNAAAISNMRIIKFADDLFRQSVNLKQ